MIIFVILSFIKEILLFAQLRGVVVRNDPTIEPLHPFESLNFQILEPLNNHKPPQTKWLTG